MWGPVRYTCGGPGRNSGLKSRSYQFRSGVENEAPLRTETRRKLSGGVQGGKPTENGNCNLISAHCLWWQQILYMCPEKWGIPVRLWWGSWPLLRFSVTLHCLAITIKSGFHYPSWRPELTGDWFPLPVNTGRVDGRPVSTSRVDGHPSTRAVNSGSGNRALVLTVALEY